MKWIPMNRDLKEGEIIRATYTPDNIYYFYDNVKRDSLKRNSVKLNKDGNKTFKISLFPDKQFRPKKPLKMYAIAKGGFGMNIGSMGNAIFVEHISDKFEETKQKKSPYSSRWEKYWDIEIMEK